MVTDVVAICGHIAVRLERNYNLLIFAHSETDDFKKEWLCFFVIESIETEVVTNFQGMENRAFSLDLITLLVVGSCNQFKARFLLQ